MPPASPRPVCSSLNHGHGVPSINFVALNAERAEEEKRGHIRELRPDYQAPGGQQAVAQVLDLGKAAEVVSATVIAPKPWPNPMREQVALIRDALAGAAAAVSAKAPAKRYKGVGPEKVEEVLVTLAALGQARMLEDDRFAGYGRRETGSRAERRGARSSRARPEIDPGLRPGGVAEADPPAGRGVSSGAV